MTVQSKGINIIFWVLMVNGVLCGQERGVHLGIQSQDRREAWLLNEFRVKDYYPDTASMRKALRQVIRDLHERSYLEASLDTLLQKSPQAFTAIVHIGPAYDWVRLRTGNIPGNWLSKAGYREKGFRKKPFSFRKYQKIQEKLLEQAENNGYPFARVFLEDIEFRQGGIAATLQMERDSLIRISGLKVDSEVRISDLYLENYLGIRPNTPYNQARILRVRDRVRELAFLENSADPTVTFAENRAWVNLRLKKKRSSKFDFIIGVLPNSRETGRLLITGNFNGEFLNQFGQGERIYVAFEQLRPETQRLDLQFNYPYVLNLPFGVDFSFNLYKRDSSYLDLAFDFGIQYLLEGGNYIKAFWNNQGSNLLAINESLLRSRQELPESLDYNNAAFGIELLQQKLDYRFNPRRGWSVFARGGAGTKTIRRNNEIVNLELGNLYDSLQLRTFQYRLEGRLEGYLPLFNRSTVKLGLRGGAIIAESPIYFNEQFRIGGNQILRGFDEESIFATNFAVLTTEYRILIGPNSYLYAFGDLAYVENITASTEDTDRISGFGAGITFETKVGLFGLSLAYGRTKRLPFDFGTPKMHFGYVSLF